VAGDGKTVMLGLQNEREWDKFCKVVLLQPELLTDERFSSNPRRVANRDALREAITTIFGMLTSDQVVLRLEEAQIANAHVNDMHDVWKHPQLQARERWILIETPAGTVPALLPPGKTDAYAPRMDPVPGLGEHSESILREFGWSAADVSRLRQVGAI
jgi:itaconate CoA-transferase